MGVIIARLIINKQNKGLHAFFVEMRNTGVIRTNMGKKLNFNSLDNALIEFNFVRLHKNSLLNRFCDIKDSLYTSKKKF